MNKFKVGDIVECVNSLGYDGVLVEGEHYEVTCVIGQDEIYVHPVKSRLVHTKHRTTFFDESRFALQQTRWSAPAEIAPIKSDGGSSDYYKLSIKRSSDGQVFECEVSDIIVALVGDNFKCGNILKALRRMWLASQGGGKAGVDMMYDAKKIKYFTDEFVRMYGSNGS